VCVAETEQIPLTVYVVADFDTEGGLGLVREALKSIVRPVLHPAVSSCLTSFRSQDDESKTRVSFVHNPAPRGDADSAVRPPVSWLLSHLLAKNLLSKATPPRLLRALGLDVPPPVSPPSDGPQIPLSKDDDDDLTGGVGLSGYSAEEYDRFVRSSRLVARELQLAPGQQALVVNGRVSGPPLLPGYRARRSC